MAPQQINWAIYNSLPPAEARYQLSHVNDSKDASTAAAYAICLPMAIIAIIMRFVSRRMGRTPYGADDWVIVLAFVLAVAFSTAANLCTFKYGAGRHEILMTDTDPLNFAKALFAAELSYPPTIAAVKISTLLLFGRIFPDRKFRRFLWTIGIFVSTYTAITTLTTIFQCRPIKGAWDPTLDVDCIQIKLVYIVMGSMNVLTDFALLFAPLPQLWNLQIRRDTKIELIGIFSIGGFVTIVSIYRIFKLNSFSFLDPGWSDNDASIWSIVEISVAIVCASTITYRPLFNWIFRIHSSPSGSSAARMTRPGAIGKPYLRRKLTDSTPSKGGDVTVRMQALGPASSYGKPRMSGNGDGFYRMEDSVEI
ncbi:MAG: hypothetical protein ASARMPRED_000617 [Alectoria sarmentosa]|nr:MAG: hypothetical protein ASARMPRED_000617 [Alectoria sarmentosa]